MTGRMIMLYTSRITRSFLFCMDLLISTVILKREKDISPKYSKNIKEGILCQSLH